MAFILAVFILIYSVIILLLIFGFSLLKRQKTGENDLKSAGFEPKITFSICIAFRDEAENLPALLKSLSQLDYSSELYEILLIDDFSTDNSTETITDFCLKTPDFEPKMAILSQKSASASGKKAALTRAILKAKHDFILTTDADCIVPKTWLSELNSFILQQNKTFIAGPVALMESSASFLNSFQQLDFLSLQGATQGGFGIKKPFLCNGANLAFAKAEFLRLNGYGGNIEIASGDDIFLMQKFLKDDPEKVGYLKSKKSIVKTQPQKDWHQLLNQRKRWAAKATKYQNVTASIVSWTVFLANFASILAVFYLKTSIFIGIILLLKIILDFLLIAKAAHFFGKTGYLLGYLGSFLIYPFFTVYIALSSQLQSFEWKGRRLKK